MDKFVKDIIDGIGEFADFMFSSPKEEPKEKEGPKKHKWKAYPVEKGIEDLVDALNNHGLETTASCEGHKDKYKYVAFKLPKGVSLTMEEDGISIHWLEDYGD